MEQGFLWAIWELQLQGFSDFHLHVCVWRIVFFFFFFLTVQPGSEGRVFSFGFHSVTLENMSVSAVNYKREVCGLGLARVTGVCNWHTEVREVSHLPGYRESSVFPPPSVLQTLRLSQGHTP